MTSGFPRQSPSWAVSPIGFVRSPFRERAQAPRQGRAAAEVRGRVELLEGCHFEDALEDLDTWRYVWLITFFEQNRGWRPKVRPPRSEHKRGVFATRAPYRPNPIGLTPVRLLSVEGLTLHVAEIDLLDGTPVLDIKPYVAWADAIPEAGEGWLGEAGGRPMDPGPRYQVTFAPRAEEQLAFLRDAHGIELRERIETVLATGPRPHAYRRIRPLSGDQFELAVKDWRARFVIEGQAVHVRELRSGFRKRPRPAAHAAFVGRFG